MHSQWQWETSLTGSTLRVNIYREKWKITIASWMNRESMVPLRTQWSESHSHTINRTLPHTTSRHHAHHFGCSREANQTVNETHKLRVKWLAINVFCSHTQTNQRNKKRRREKRSECSTYKRNGRQTFGVLFMLIRLINWRRNGVFQISNK